MRVKEYKKWHRLILNLSVDWVLTLKKKKNHFGADLLEQEPIKPAKYLLILTFQGSRQQRNDGLSIISVVWNILTLNKHGHIHRHMYYQCPKTCLWQEKEMIKGLWGIWKSCFLSIVLHIYLWRCQSINLSPHSALTFIYCMSLHFLCAYMLVICIQLLFMCISGSLNLNDSFSFLMSVWPHSEHGHTIPMRVKDNLHSKTHPFTLWYNHSPSA